MLFKIALLYNNSYCLVKKMASELWHYFAAGNTFSTDQKNPAADAFQGVAYQRVTKLTRRDHS